MKKLDVNVEMPDEIDLEAFRGHGKQPEEMLLPHESAKSELSLGRPLPGIDPDVFHKVNVQLILDNCNTTKVNGWLNYIIK